MTTFIFFTAIFSIFFFTFGNADVGPLLASYPLIGNNLLDSTGQTQAQFVSLPGYEPECDPEFRLANVPAIGATTAYHMPCDINGGGGLEISPPIAVNQSLSISTLFMWDPTSVNDAAYVFGGELLHLGVYPNSATTNLWIQYNQIVLEYRVCIGDYEWAHSVVTWDGSALLFYLNGVLQTPANISSALVFGPASTIGNNDGWTSVIIGGMPISSLPHTSPMGTLTTTMRFPGYLTAFKMFSVSLSNDLVNTLYLQDTTMACPTSPTAPFMSNCLQGFENPTVADYEYSVAGSLWTWSYGLGGFAIYGSPFDPLNLWSNYLTQDGSQYMYLQISQYLQSVVSAPVILLDPTSQYRLSFKFGVRNAFRSTSNNCQLQVAFNGAHVYMSATNITETMTSWERITTPSFTTQNQTQGTLRFTAICSSHDDTSLLVDSVVFVSHKNS